MIKIGLCDDNYLFIKKLSEILKDLSKSEGLNIEITSFESSKDLLDFYGKNKSYFDVIFLDILMDNDRLNGIETSKIIRKTSSDIFIIFVTSSKDYALESYSVNAFSYILKPFSKEDIKSKFLDVYKKIELNKKNIFYVKNNQDIFTLDLNKVLYFESNLRKITAHLINGEKLSFYNKMSNLEEEIKDRNFLRIHRSFLVNLLYVKNIISKDLITTTNKALPISSKYLSSSKDIFTSYIKVKLSS